MKLFNKWLNGIHPIVKNAFANFAPLIEVKTDPRGLLVSFDADAARNAWPSDPQSAGLWASMAARFRNATHLTSVQTFETVNIWATGFAFREGLKVYCPTAHELESLANVEMRIPWSEYRQPFRSMVIAIPDGMTFDLKSGIRPVCLIARHDESAQVLAVTVPTVDGTGRPVGDLCGHYATRSDDDRTIEEYIGTLPDDPSIDEHEDRLVNRLVRVAINANLLLSNKGAKRIGAANPDYEAKLRKSLDKKTLPESVRKANEQALRELPIVYGFEQHVRVYEQEGGTAAGGEGGHNVRPHWRRGHWAHQRHGPAGSLRKLIFRPAVMVNAAQFGGELSDTKAVYTTAGSGA